MGLAVLRDREKPIVRALENASEVLGVHERPLKVLALYLDSASDIQKAYGEAKRQLGAVEVVVLPAPIILDAERHSVVISILKQFGLSYQDAQKATARIIRQLA